MTSSHHRGPILAVDSQGLEKAFSEHAENDKDLFAFGIYASAGVSGGHVNPAVTIAMATLGRLGKTAGENAVMFALYSISQILGAFLRF